MHQRTRTLLSELCSKHTRASLVTLWTELNRLSKVEFIAELDRLREDPKPPATKKRKKNPRKPVPKDDRPETRIAFVLEHERKLEQRDAQLQLSKILIERGYSPTAIPRAGNGTLANWISRLIKNIPSSEVIDAARSLRS